MSSVRVPGSVYPRSSGRWTAVTSSVFDPVEGRRRRIRLGTFESEEVALAALSEFKAFRLAGEVGRRRLDEYLADWLVLRLGYPTAQPRQRTCGALDTAHQ
jgi:hypothetical protein